MNAPDTNLEILPPHGRQSINEWIAVDAQITTEYDEPWQFNENRGLHPIVDAQGKPLIMGDFFTCSENKLKRAVSCVNALAGISDPEAALKAARDALLEVVKDGRSSFAVCGAVNKALELLAPDPL